MITLAEGADTTDEQLQLAWTALAHPDTGSSAITSYNLQIHDDATAQWVDVIG